MITMHGEGMVTDVAKGDEASYRRQRPMRGIYEIIKNMGIILSWSLCTHINGSFIHFVCLYIYFVTCFILFLCIFAQKL